MANDELTIGVASSDDIADLLALYRELIPEDPTLSHEVAQDRLATLTRYPDSGVLLGRAHGVAASSCTLIVIPNMTRGGRPYALIENVVTAAARRRRGYGRHIIKAALQRAQAADCYKVMVLADARNEAAHAFYSAVGFEPSKTGFAHRFLPLRDPSSFAAHKDPGSN